jgi:hypothetical protein
MHALVRRHGAGAQDISATSPTITPHVETLDGGTALKKHSGRRDDGDADELIEMRYQEHLARSELQSLFEDGGLVAAPDRLPSGMQPS